MSELASGRSARGDLTSGSVPSDVSVPAPAEPVGAIPAVPDPTVGDVAVPQARTRPTSPATGAGSTLAGRYHLRTLVGTDPGAGAEFWCARDQVLQRDVGITVLRALPAELGAVGGEGDPTGLERAHEMVARALRSGAFEHSACARLLDVLTPGSSGLPPDVLGAAVNEWVPGSSLAETVATAPMRPIAVARALRPLAAAVEEAHRHGLLLGVDQPERIRVRPDGTVLVCFALPRHDLRPTDDVRGLGAVLVTLLTARWPLAGAAAAGLPAAGWTRRGELEPPSAVRPGVPVELDALATGTLGPETVPGHVRTAAAVNQLLGEVIEEQDRGALLPPMRDGLPTDPTDVWQDAPALPEPEDPQRRHRMRVTLAALAAVVVLIVGYTAFQLTSMFGDPSTPAFVVEDPPGAAPAGGRAAVAGVEIYSGGAGDGDGDGDNPARVTRVIDGDVGSSWRTSTYRQQLPTLKPGIGIMISFVSPVQLSGLTITSPSEGTRLQVRSAPAPDAPFAETTPMATAELHQLRTTVSLTQSQPVQYVLVWIDRLGGGDGAYVSEVNELEFRRSLT